MLYFLPFHFLNNILAHPTHCSLSPFLASVWWFKTCKLFLDCRRGPPTSQLSLITELSLFRRDWQHTELLPAPVNLSKRNTRQVCVCVYNAIQKWRALGKVKCWNIKYDWWMRNNGSAGAPQHLFYFWGEWQVLGLLKRQAGDLIIQTGGVGGREGAKNSDFFFFFLFSNLCCEISDF